MKYTKIFIRILIEFFIVSIFVVYFYSRIYSDTRLKDLQVAEDIVESIKEANISSDHDFLIEMCDYYNNVYLYKFIVNDGTVYLYDYDNRVKFDLEIVLNALENLPHFAGKYSKFLMEKTKNNLDSSNNILKVLENGKNKNKYNNKTNK